MVVTRELVARLEQIEAAVVAADLRRRGDATVEAWRDGILTAVPGNQHHSRAHAVTMQDLDDAAVGELVDWFADHHLDALVQLAAWAPVGTVAALAAAGSARPRRNSPS